MSLVSFVFGPFCIIIIFAECMGGGKMRWKMTPNLKLLKNEIKENYLNSCDELLMGSWKELKLNSDGKNSQRWILLRIIDTFWKSLWKACTWKNPGKMWVVPFYQCFWLLNTLNINCALKKIWRNQKI